MIEVSFCPRKHGGWIVEVVGTPDLLLTKGDIRLGLRNSKLAPCLLGPIHTIITEGTLKVVFTVRALPQDWDESQAHTHIVGLVERGS